jgi:hypothetical protein
MFGQRRTYIRNKRGILILIKIETPNVLQDDEVTSTLDDEGPSEGIDG